MWSSSPTANHRRLWIRYGEYDFRRRKIASYRDSGREAGVCGRNLRTLGRRETSNARGPPCRIAGRDLAEAIPVSAFVSTIPFADGIHNGAQTDIGCACPNTGGLGQGCASNDDCQPSACDPDTLECVAPTACVDFGNWRHLLPDHHQRASPPEHHAGPPAIGTDADDRYTVAWTSGSKNTFGVYLQRYEPTGEAVGEMLQFSGPSQFVTQTPAVAANATGELVAAYLGSDSNAEGPFVRKFDSSGRPLGALTLASPPAHYLGSLSPAVDISDDGSFVVAWSPEQSAPPSVWLQAVAPDGSPSGEPIQVSPDEGLVP